MSTPDAEAEGLNTLLTPPDLHHRGHHQVEDVTADDTGNPLVRDRHRSKEQADIDAQPSHGLLGSGLQGGKHQARQPGDLFLQIHKTIFFVLAGVSATLDHFATPVRRKLGSLLSRGGSDHQQKEEHTKHE